MRTEADQHDANDGFQRSRQMFRNRVTKKDRCAGENEQCDGVTQPPGQPVLDDVSDAGSPGRNAGHCCNVIGLKGVLHSDKKAEA